MKQYDYLIVGSGLLDPPLPVWLNDKVRNVWSLISVHSWVAIFIVKIEGINVLPIWSAYLSYFKQRSVGFCQL